MRLYKDRELTSLIDDCITFGIVPVEESKTITVWIQNDSSPKVTGRLVNLIFEVICLNPENDAPIVSEKVEVLKAPEELEPWGVEELILKWSPNVDLEQGLKARLTIKGNKIIG